MNATRPRVQCKHCPWKQSTNPRDISNGYSVEKHKKLRCTIAEEGKVDFGSPLRVMACHETHRLHCVGWLVNQLGPGNNIALRMRVASGAIDANVRTVGPQWSTLEETLPEGEEPA